MNSETVATVYRYFELADSFVEIRRVGGDLTLPSAPGLDRESYEQHVIELCVAGLGEDVVRELAALFPEDAAAASRALYELCVEVNPGLDIRAVRLHAEQRKASPSPTSEAEDPEALLEHLRRRSRGLEQRLARRVMGQGRAVAALARAVRKAAAGLGAEDRPLASVLLTGRTGTGKTELARALASELFAGRPGSPASGLLRIDCSEFALPHEYAKLIGAPPGYVGHDDGGRLTDAMASSGAAVVLFDEIEKAHSKLHDLLLQVLEEGALTDGQGRTVRFERAIVVLTSNAGASEVAARDRAMGFGARGALGRKELEGITSEALARCFSPEFLGRLDEVLVFDELDLAAATRIARKELAALGLRARRRGVMVAFTPALARWVAERGFAPESGARELRRVIQRMVEPPLSELLLDPSLPAGALVRARVRGGRPHFTLEE